MIYPGTDLKFRITATQPDFQLSEDWFEIRIKDQYGRVRYTIGKSDCFWDDQGAWYFVMDDVRKGIYYAFFHGRYEDEDYDDQRRDFTDVQELCRVGYKGGGCCGTRRRTDGHGGNGCRCEHVVHYEQVWTVSIDGDEYLCDCDGRYILTADNKRICFKNDKATQIDDMGKVRLDTLTGDQFKQLIEGNNPNGEIDTIPEQLRAMQGISDDTTIKEDVSDSMVGNLTDEDMEKWFDDDPTNDDPEEETPDNTETETGE